MKNRYAIVYDWMDKWGGVERILLSLHEMYPEADFFTSYYDSKTASWARDFSIKTSFIQKMPDWIKKNRLFSLPFFPYAFETFDFSTYDKVISVTSSFAKGIITKPSTEHICYLLTPTRFLWGQQEHYLTHKMTAFGGMTLGSTLRQWDMIAAQRPDKVISISHLVANRAQKYYNRESQVIYPPFDLEYWQKIDSTKVDTPEQFLLVVSRLEPYKKVDVVIEACNRFKKTLVVVGKGSEETKLRNMAGPTISFKKDLSDSELAYLYSQADALIMPQEEDFGYVALEAQCLGCPVISFFQSGARETILEGVTGVFFNEQSVSGIITILERFEDISYNLKRTTKTDAVHHLRLFSKERFVKAFEEVVKGSPRPNAP
jgi:glycosyltransferase involved in cell wall biosynthesis